MASGPTTDDDDDDAGCQTMGESYECWEERGSVPWSYSGGEQLIGLTGSAPAPCGLYVLLSTGSSE